MRRLAVLLLALAALTGVSAPQPAAADEGIISSGIAAMCKAGGDIVDFFGGDKGPHADGKCKTLGAAVELKAHQEWDKISDSLLGDVIESAAGLAKWTIRHVLTLGLAGPSLDLKATGLWGGKATLAGMLVWLGLVIAAAGVMWQLAKMAVTGQVKHLGRAAVGWGESFLISTLGVSLFGLLLTLGDTITDGLVRATFEGNDAYARIVAVMVPTGVANPVAVGGLVSVLLLLGIVQMVMVFMRLSAIPIICLLLPIAGAGRTGGDVTRKWAPALITSGLVVIVYKPIVAILICTGFAQFGHGETLTEWLRGAATLVLAIVAPIPLTRLFAPFGVAYGGGAGGAGALLGSAGGVFAGKEPPMDRGEVAAPATPMQHAAWVAKSMDGGGDPGAAKGGASGGPDGLPGSDAPGRGGRGGPDRGDGQQAPPPETPKIPAQTSATTPSAVPATSGSGAATPGAPTVGIGIQIMDGVNDVVRKTTEEAGGGNGQ